MEVSEDLKIVWVSYLEVPFRRFRGKEAISESFLAVLVVFIFKKGKW